MENNNTNLKTKKKPKWVRILEQQSWQAELLISGIAIFGSLQLPALITEWQGYLVINSNASTSFFYGLLFTYIFVGIFGVIINFILHFVLRALWVGIIGMNSVFPDGIKTDTSVFGEDFMQIVKDKYPDVNDFNAQLDRLGSIMFSISAAFAMVFIAIAIDMIIISLVIYFIHFIFPNFGEYIIEHWFIIPFILFIFIIPLYFILVMKLIQKKTKYLQKYNIAKLQFKAGDRFNKIFLHIFYLPYTYIFYTLNSNIKTKYSGPILVIYMFVVSFFAFPANQTGITSAFSSSENYFLFNNYEHVLNKYNYQNLKPDDALVFTPIIDSDIVKGKFLKLFLPNIYRELKASNNLYGKIVSLDSLSRQENRIRSRQINLERQLDFNTIYINDQVYPNLEYFSHLTENKTRGYLTYIPTDNFKIGRNILKIEKKYFDDDKKPKTVIIPFMFEGF